MITPDGQRTVLSVRGEQHPFTPPSDPLLARCRIVSVSRFGAGTLTAAVAARKANRLVVIGDALLPDDTFAPLADVIVGSYEFLRSAVADADVVAHMRRLQSLRGAAVVLTDGPHAVHALVDGLLIQARPPTISPVDTNGAGDCFRAGVTHGLAQSWEWPRILGWACAAASAWCLKENNEPPSVAEVEALL
jgi:sugar/nucleoside kinase (ribokinase family)